MSSKLTIQDICMSPGTFFMILCMMIMLTTPSMPRAADLISLDRHERKLVAQGEVVVREIGSAGKDGRTFEAIGLVKASRGDIMGVLKDYKKYPEFMPNVSRIEIVEQRGNEAVISYTLSLPLGKIKKYRLKISEKSPEKQLSVLEWQMLNWPGLKIEESIKDTNGFWQIEEKNEDLSLLLYHVYTDPGPVPFGLGWIVDVLTKKSVPDVLLQTRHRAEKFSQKKK